MRIRFLFAIVFGVALTMTAFSQDANSGQRGGGGITGTVTEVAADHYIIKTDGGETYTIHFSANTRIMKQTVRQRGEGGGNPPQPLKSTDIKVGDAVAALGEVDAAAKSVGAVVVLQLDPERAKQIREMQANFGKTWLMGKVTAINETKVSIFAAVDNAAHAFVADENTTFRKRREPITLADLQVGDRVRVEGAVKDGIFVAASVTVMGMPPGATPSVPRDAAPAPQPN
jgi:preprotein translocase subunit YajC